MAANLVKAGYAVTGYNRSRAKVDKLVEAGGTRRRQHRRGGQGRRRDHHDGAGLPRRRGRGRSGEDGIFANAKSGAVWVDCSSIRPDVVRQAGRAGRPSRASGRSTPRSPAARPAPSRPRCRSWSAATPIDLRGGTPGPGGGRQDRRPRRPVRLRPDRQGRQPADRGRQPSSWSPRRSSSSRRTAWTPTPPSKVLAGGLAGNRILDRKATSMVAREFKPGFRVDLHHKDMGIILAAAARSRRRHPPRRAHAQLIVAASARATAAWTTRPCCCWSSSCPAARPRTDSEPTTSQR